MHPIPCKLSSGSSASCCRALARAARPQLQRQSLPIATQCRRNLTTTTTPPRPQFSRTQPQPQPQPQLHRPYHSYDHPSPPRPFSPTERIILSAAYAHVPEHGFTAHTLALGARDAGYLDISTNLLPDGVFSLIQWHMVSQREVLAAVAPVLFGKAEEEAAGRKLSVGRKVEMLTWERLMGNAEIIARWQEALAIMAQPIYVPASLRELAQLSDEIWFLVGDVAVDPSWYTKRASLSAIYASTELFMTTDRSEGFEETRKFLQRRLADVQDIGGSLRSISQWVGFTASAGLNVLRSKGMRI